MEHSNVTAPPESLIAKVCTAASEFRNAIEQCDRSRWDEAFQCFPTGCCGETVLLLGAYLEIAGFGSGEYVMGQRGDGHTPASHAWLLLSGLIVDVTGDQFEDCPERVIVAAKSPWHETFEEQSRCAGDFRVYDGQTSIRLAGMLGAILDNVDEQSCSNVR